MSACCLSQSQPITSNIFLIYCIQNKFENKSIQIKDLCETGTIDQLPRTQLPCRDVLYGEEYTTCSAQKIIADTFSPCYTLLMRVRKK